MAKILVLVPFFFLGLIALKEIAAKPQALDGKSANDLLAPSAGSLSFQDKILNSQL